jgi:hypothetical protein
MSVDQTLNFLVGLPSIYGGGSLLWRRFRPSSEPLRWGKFQNGAVVSKRSSFIVGCCFTCFGVCLTLMGFQVAGFERFVFPVVLTVTMIAMFTCAVIDARS